MIVDGFVFASKERQLPRKEWPDVIIERFEKATSFEELVKLEPRLADLDSKAKARASEKGTTTTTWYQERFQTQLDDLIPYEAYHANDLAFWHLYSYFEEAEK